MRISVIMSTYFREQPQYLDAAMKSIWTDQTRKPDEIVLVEDGPLVPGLDAVVDKWQKIIGDALVVIKRSKNGGLASALNKAIDAASGDLLARMDSDDISLPDRFAVQEKYMAEHPEVDILGGGLREFNDAGTLDKVRIYPATMDDVKKSMHRMCPLGHPTVVFRRRFFDDGFRYNGKYHICEDVTMWYDAACAGRIINNIPDVVLRFRRNDSTMNRRSREKAWSEFCAYNDGIYRLWGLFTTRYFFSFMRMIFRLLPASIIKVIYKQGHLRNKMS